jgi:HK97 gp10 family phage protein
MDVQMQRELDQISRKFQKLFKSLDEKTLDDVLTYSAQPLIQALKVGAPRSKRRHFRYDTPKLVRGVRAPNGRGVKVATFEPGNLGRAMKKLALRRLKKAIMIGPKTRRGNNKGVFNTDRKVDGYYAHFVEKGTTKQRGQGFIKSAAAATKGTVLRRMEKSFETLLKREINRLGFGDR